MARKKKKKKKKGEAEGENGFENSSAPIKVKRKVDEADVVRALFWLVILCILGAINNC